MLIFIFKSIIFFSKTVEVLFQIVIVCVALVIKTSERCYFGAQGPSYVRFYFVMAINTQGSIV